MDPTYGPSPYPSLDGFIESIATHGGVQGRIRNWLRLPQSHSVQYNMMSNRWCANVQRAHKSNGIYFVVDLRAGVWYQKCFDPECRGFRSEFMPLPPAVWEHCWAQEGEAAQEAGQPPVQRQQAGFDAAAAAAAAALGLPPHSPLPHQGLDSRLLQLPPHTDEVASPAAGNLPQTASPLIDSMRTAPIAGPITSSHVYLSPWSTEPAGAAASARSPAMQASAPSQNRVMPEDDSEDAYLLEALEQYERQHCNA